MKYQDLVVVTGDDTQGILHDYGRQLLTQPSLIGLELNIAWPGTCRFSKRIWGTDTPVFAGVISRCHDSPTAPLDTEDVRCHWTFTVDEHIGIPRPRTWPLGEATPGLKHLSLLCGTVPTAEFRAAYRHHVELVHEHLPTMWRYVQNDIDRAVGPRASEFAAISELSYESQVEYDRRWAKGDAGEEEFRSHEGFLDLPKTVTMMCTEYILR